MSATEWSELDVAELLPMGTVTLLLADVEGSTRLWESAPAAMTSALARLNHVVGKFIAEHGGVRPVEQGEGDSFVAAFVRASDAVACALALQQTDLLPIKLRIGIHTGEVQLRDAANYAGPAINKTARLRDLGHGGQTVLSGVTADLVEDKLPDDSWLSDLGTYALRDLPRPARVAQLCHSDLCNDFPPLRTANADAALHLPAQLTSFVGRETQVCELRDMCLDNRLVTLTGAGGAGKTRLAIEVAGGMTSSFSDGIWYADLAPVTQPGVVPVTIARALGLPDQSGLSTTETLLRYLRGRHLLLVLDNCEHLLEACAGLVNEMLAGCVKLAILATSREPLMVSGEVNWQVPSLSLEDEAVALFADRARLARPGFQSTATHAATVTEICRRLDGMPLAIELAAARVRALTLEEILDSLHDRFRLLTGGGRTAVRRQQTLRASVDWSHALLTEPERTLLRRLAVFMGGFDLDGAQSVAGANEIERFQVLDQLSLLVDKSLVVVENTGGRSRYRLLETVRQYAQEKLAEADEADTVRGRHRDHYTALAARLDAPAHTDHGRLIRQAETEIDNLRTALGWSLESKSTDAALQLASSLQPLWIARGRLQEGLTWLDAVLAETGTSDQAARTRAVADRLLLLNWTGALQQDTAEQALHAARQLGESRLLITALLASGMTAYSDLETGGPYFTEAARLARATNDSWRLSLILGIQANVAAAAGDPVATAALAEEGRDVAQQIGDEFTSHQCGVLLSTAQLFRGDVSGGVRQGRDAVAEATVARDRMSMVQGSANVAFGLAHGGEIEAARVAARAALDDAGELGDFYECMGYAMLVVVALADGDTVAAGQAGDAGRRQSDFSPAIAGLFVSRWADAALAQGDYTTARQWADDAVAATHGWHRSAVLTTRARIEIATGEFEAAERDAHDALVTATEVQTYLFVPDILECLAHVADASGSRREAVRLLAAAHQARQQMGSVRFKVFDPEVDMRITELREVLEGNDFDAAWAEGAALSITEAIAYAQRGRGERKRPSTGWASLTPTELDVVRLVAEGHPNKDISTRLFVSPRTVQSHLRHVYRKLDLTSRVQLAQEASRRGPTAGIRAGNGASIRRRSADGSPIGMPTQA